MILTQCQRDQILKPLSIVTSAISREGAIRTLSRMVMSISNESNLMGGENIGFGAVTAAGENVGGAIADTGEVVAASDDDGGDDDADPDPRRIKRSRAPSISVNPSASALLRKPAVLAETGISKSTLYQNIANGLFTKPVKIGARASGWPAHEVHAINAARIAGKTDKQIMALVDSLETARKAAA